MGRKAPLRIFVNYRRDDDMLRATILVSQLESTFNADGRQVEIFRDTDQRLGVAWPDRVRSALGAADIVLVLIGPNWLAAKDQYQRFRIEQPDDWVRQEIELALSTHKLVIPLVFGDRMPPAGAIPESIASLVERQAAFVRDGALQRDLEPLVLEVQRILAGRPKSAPTADSDRRLPYPQPPMKFPPAPIPRDDLSMIVAEELTAWDVVRQPVRGKPDMMGVELHRDLAFRAFADVVPFLAVISDFADKANHHPRWENIFRTLSIYLSTWDIGHQVSSLDLMMASHIDRTYDAYLRRVEP